MKQCKFYVGQEVVLVDPPTDPRFPKSAKNKVFRVLAISQTPCCGTWTINIGLNGVVPTSACICGGAYTKPTWDWWLREARFAPVLPAKEVSFVELKEEHPIYAN